MGNKVKTYVVELSDTTGKDFGRDRGLLKAMKKLDKLVEKDASDKNLDIESVSDSFFDYRMNPALRLPETEGYYLARVVVFGGKGK